MSSTASRPGPELKPLTRDAILAANDLPTAPVDCPEWNGVVHVRGLTLAELLETTANGQNVVDHTSKVLVACIVDPHGVPLFTPADVQALQRKAAAPLTRLARQINTLSGLETDETDRGKATAPEA